MPPCVRSVGGVDIEAASRILKYNLAQYPNGSALYRSRVSLENVLIPPVAQHLFPVLRRSTQVDPDAVGRSDHMLRTSNRCAARVQAARSYLLLVRPDPASFPCLRLR